LFPHPHSIKDYFKLKYKQADIYDDDERFKTDTTMTIDRKTMTLRVKIILLSLSTAISSLKNCL
jgi:hypothetical protein